MGPIFGIAPSGLGSVHSAGHSFDSSSHGSSGQVQQLAVVQWWFDQCPDARGQLKWDQSGPVASSQTLAEQTQEIVQVEWLDQRTAHPFSEPLARFLPKRA